MTVILAAPVLIESQVTHYLPTERTERPEPGWIRSKACVSGPLASAIAARGPGTTAFNSWRSVDTLQPTGGLGSVFRFKLKRNGVELLRDQDFRIPIGDSLLVFAAPIGTGDTVCWDRATTPLMVQSGFSLYRRDQVPVFRQQVLDSSRQVEIFSSINSEDTAYSKYRLNYSGSKSMAVTVGSGGGLGLDASLFINLDGQVAEDVFLEGQLSDQNVPVQPDGNTATLKEVDTKFMRVYGKHYAYVLGNYLLDYGVDGEDRFRAKVEGVNGSYSRGDYGLRGSWSISDGQYQSDTLRGVDGKQRGYYLRGRNGRQFITVLAGTERIWRNGNPLKRGIDYTIDYGEGRLDFLPGVVVTSENLFSAEFQYTDEEYQRSLSSGEVKDSAGPLTWSIRAISELENKDKPLALVLDSALLRRYSSSGDSAIVDTLGRRLQMPQRQSSAALDLALILAGFQGRGVILFSERDRNLYSSRDDADNLGYSTRYHGQYRLGKAIDHGGWGQSDFLIEHEYRAPQFESFKQLIEPRAFLETWNLNPHVAERGFLANRITWEETPFSKLRLSAEIGRADADAAMDTASARASDGSQSRRGGLGVRLGGEQTFVEVQSQAKIARSPDRSDNYRQQGRLAFAAGGFTPSLVLTRNEWLANLVNFSQARSIKEEPEFTVSTAPFLGGVSLVSGLYLLSQRGNFAGRLPDMQDSVRDVGVTQKVDAIGIGPWNTDFFYSFHNHRLWHLTPTSVYAGAPEENNFHQVEWNNHIANQKQGYSLASSYRVTQTAEFPLVDSFALVKGRGNYIKDTLQNVYNPVSTAGDYILIGLMRDTTVGSSPYQDLSWTANLELNPSKFPFTVTGVLADIEFTLDLAMDHQDTTGRLGLLPLFVDAQIESARSGRSRYSPALHWKAPSGPRKTVDLYVDRSFNLAAGIYAFREKVWKERSNFRNEFSEDWEYALDQSYENRQREGLSTGPSAISENENYTYGTRLQRKLPRAFSLEGRTEYLVVNGSSSMGPVHLQGFKPGLKLEKSSVYNGRAFLDYGIIYFWGTGQGGFYTTGEFVRGVTHRAQANANFQVGENMYLNFDYVIRLEPPELEPNGQKINQKFSAEARAVF